MSLSFDLSPFELTKKDRVFVSSSLKKFSEGPLSQTSKKDLQRAKKKWREITKSHSPIFLFALGGTGSTKKILNSLFPEKKTNVFLIENLHPTSLDHLSNLKKTELQSAYSLFFSKSGKTEEILFYTSFLKKIYKKANLSLKNKFTVISQSEDNPLAKWGKKEGGDLLLSDSPLPGRFSFFNLNGLLQSQAYTSQCKINSFNNLDKTEKALQFFIHYKKKKEIYLCPFSPKMQEICYWLESSWSESLFKKEAALYPPLLRSITFPQFQHACIQEILTKKNKVLFWGLGVNENKYKLTKEDRDKMFSYQKSKRDKWTHNKEENRFQAAHTKRIKKLLQKNKLPYLFMSLSLDQKNSISDCMRTLYQILFLMGESVKANIYTQPWVDHLKNKFTF